MCRIIGIEEIRQEEWDGLVKLSPVATWFQTREAYDFFKSLSFLETVVVAVENAGRLKGVVVGYVQKDGGWLEKYFSRRAIIFGGPLLANDITEQELGLLLLSLKDYLRQKAIYIETRNYNDYSIWQSVFEGYGFYYEPHYDIHVDTSTMPTVDENLGKSRKRDIRVSFRDGATIVEHPTIEQVKACYSILKDLYQTKVKTPLFPLEFFEKLFELSSSVVLLVEYEGKIIGGTFCVGLQGKALYEMYACGQDGLYKNIHPSELATYAGLKWAAENGFVKFDMMGAGKPGDGGYGVRDFKLKFGGQLLDQGRFICVCNRMLFDVGRFGVKMLKKL